MSAAFTGAEGDERSGGVGDRGVTSDPIAKREKVGRNDPPYAGGGFPDLSGKSCIHSLRRRKSLTVKGRRPTLTVCWDRARARFSGETRAKTEGQEEWRESPLSFNSSKSSGYDRSFGLQEMEIPV